jgi:hypothetical protein
MKHSMQTILLGGLLAAALGACSSTGHRTDSSSGTSGTSGAAGTTSSGTSGAAGTTSSGTSGATGTTSSGSDTDTHGNNTRLTPPPVASPSSTGAVIDDRINENTDVPGQKH